MFIIRRQEVKEILRYTKWMYCSKPETERMLSGVLGGFSQPSLLFTSAIKVTARCLNARDQNCQGIYLRRVCCDDSS